MALSDATAAGVHAARPKLSNAYRNLVLGLLVATYTLSFLDRTIFNIISQAIKLDLKLTDTQLGLLGGFSFVILYTMMGLPIARLAERWNRVSIISIAMVLWSAFTALCGTATSLVQLTIFRVGVGFGEAGLTPPAQSLISDYFEPKKRATAFSIYAFALPLGGMFGAALGGWLAKTYGWRAAFMIVGAPGVLMALILRLVVKEPARGHAEMQANPADPEALAPPALKPLSLSSELSELKAVAGALFGKWPLLNLVLGFALMTLATSGTNQFSPPYFIRTFGLDFATVGLITGLVSGISSGTGMLAGGFLTDWLSRRNGVWYALVPAIGACIATPIFMTAYSLDDWKAAALVLLLPGMFAHTYFGPVFGVVQNAVGAQQRATATALIYIVITVIGVGCGPLVVGWMIDHLAAYHYGHPGDGGWLSNLTGAFSASSDIGAGFAKACPGGAAPKGAAHAAAAACKVALTAGTREGQRLAFLFMIWAAAHFAMASFGLNKELRRVQPSRAA